MNEIVLGVFGFALCLGILAALALALFLIGYWTMCVKHWIEDEAKHKTSTLSYEENRRVNRVEEGQ